MMRVSRPVSRKIPLFFSPDDLTEDDMRDQTLQTPLQGKITEKVLVFVLCDEH